MPELPEVEVVKRSLERNILNLIIKKVKIKDANLRYKVDKIDYDKLDKHINERIKKNTKKMLKLNFSLKQLLIIPFLIILTTNWDAQMRF